MTEEEKALMKYVEYTTAQIKVMECPVCLDVAKAPVRQCSNGHVICSMCIAQLAQCPLCKLPYLQENPTCLNNLLEVLPRFCRYTEAGCKQVFVPGDRHEQFCGFRLVACKGESCELASTASNVLKHNSKEHITLAVSENEIGNGELEFNKSGDMTTITRLIFDNHLFFITIHNAKEVSDIIIYFEALFIGEPKNDYYLKVKFANRGYVLEKTMKAIIVNDPNKNGLEVISEISENMQDFWMRVSHSYCDSLSEDVEESNDNVRLNYTFSILRNLAQ